MSFPSSCLRHHPSLILAIIHLRLDDPKTFESFVSASHLIQSLGLQTFVAACPKVPEIQVQILMLPQIT